MRMPAVIPLIFTSTVLLAACDSFPSQQDSKEKRSANPDSTFGLVGIENVRYVGECIAETDRARSEQDSIQFSANSFVRTWINFDGRDCDPQEKRTTYLYLQQNARQELHPDLEGWNTYVYGVGSIKAIVHTEFLARSFSQERRFDYGNWVVNQPKEVAGRKFDADSQAKAAKGDTRASTVKIEGDQLFLARYKSGVAQDTNYMTFTRAN